MKKQAELRLARPRASESEHDEREFADRYPALAEAGVVLGMSGPALRKKFDRGDLPRDYLLRIGPRTLRVDISGLVHYLKGQASRMPA